MRGSKVNSFESSARVNENKKQKKKVGRGSNSSKIFSESIDYAAKMVPISKELYPLTFVKEGIVLLR